MKSTAESRQGQARGAGVCRRCSRLPASPPTRRRPCRRAAAAGASRRPPRRRSRRSPARLPEGVADGGPVDGADDRLQHHADRDHQPGDRRRDGGAAARDPDRRQGAGHHQPDRLGSGRAARSTTWSSSSRSRRCSRTCRCCSPAKTSRSAPARTRRSCRVRCRAPTSCCAPARSPQASAAKRAVINMLQVPGGSESQQVMLQVRFAEVNRRVAAGARRQLLPPARSASAARVDDAAVPGRRSSTTRARRRPGVQRLPEPVFLRPQARHRRPARALESAARSRAWPSRT